MQQLPECLRVTPPDSGHEGEAPLQGDWLSLFRSSAPYVAMFQRCIMVFHIPGHLLEHTFQAELVDLMEDIRLCALLGVRPVLVASPEHRVLARLRLEGRPDPRDPDSGQLAVDEHVLRLLKQELGAVSAELEQLFIRLGPRGSANRQSSFSVYSSSQLFSALPRRKPNGETSALLGRVHEVDTEQIQRRLNDADVVCLTPLGVGSEGRLRYVPSEELAMETARQLQASKLIFFTRGQRIVDACTGITVKAMQLRDAKNFVDYARSHADFKEDENASEVLRYMDFITKALSDGTLRGHLIDPTQGALLQELYTTDGSGTLISQDLYDGIRLASSSDVSGILGLIDPLVRKGVVKRRSGYEIEGACKRREMFVWKRDDMTTGCAQLQRFEDALDKAELGCFVVSPQCRGKGHGTVLLSYMERVALLCGIRKLFLLTTQTMQWFIERGFRQGSLDDLPPEKRRNYDMSRSSRIYVKDLDNLPSELMERFTFVEVDTLE